MLPLSWENVKKLWSGVKKTWNYSVSVLANIQQELGEVAEVIHQVAGLYVVNEMFGQNSVKMAFKHKLAGTVFSQMSLVAGFLQWVLACLPIQKKRKV